MELGGEGHSLRRWGDVQENMDKGHLGHCSGLALSKAELARHLGFCTRYVKLHYQLLSV
jgi:hypothetical protein